MVRMQIGTFKALATGISSLTEDSVKVELSAEGLKVRTMDASQVSMVSASLPLIDMDETEKGTSLNINFGKILKAVKSEKDGFIVLKGNDKAISITAGTSEASFGIEEIDRDAPNCPNLESQADRITATFEAKAIKDAIKEIGDITTSALFSWENDTLTIEGKSDEGNIKKTFQGAVSQAIKGRTRYPTQYLKDALKVIKKGKVVMLLKKDIPCELSFEVEGVQFRYWIAPQTSDEDTETEEQPTVEKVEQSAVEQPKPAEAEAVKTEATVEQPTATQPATAEVKVEEKASSSPFPDAIPEVKPCKMNRYRITLEVECEEGLTDECIDNYLDGSWFMDIDFRGAITKRTIEDITDTGELPEGNCEKCGKTKPTAISPDGEVLCEDCWNKSADEVD